MPLGPLGAIILFLLRKFFKCFSSYDYLFVLYCTFVLLQSIIIWSVLKGIRLNFFFSAHASNFDEPIPQYPVHLKQSMINKLYTTPYFYACSQFCRVRTSICCTFLKISMISELVSINSYVIIPPPRPIPAFLYWTSYILLVKRDFIFMNSIMKNVDIPTTRYFWGQDRHIIYPCKSFCSTVFYIDPLWS